jgi:hypothetical protein
MNSTKYDEEYLLNRRAYQELKDTIRRDYAGQLVALAFGRVVAVGPDHETISAALGRLDPMPEHYVVFPADVEDPLDAVESLSIECVDE